MSMKSEGASSQGDVTLFAERVPKTDTANRFSALFTIEMEFVEGSTLPADVWEDFVEIAE